MSDTATIVPAEDVTVLDSTGEDAAAVNTEEENRKNLSPCPVCGAHAAEGPEGEAWLHFDHCWSCGYNWQNPTPGGMQFAAASGHLPAHVVQGIGAAIAAQVQAQVSQQLGLPDGASLGQVLADIGQLAAALRPADQAPPPPTPGVPGFPGGGGSQ